MMKFLCSHVWKTLQRKQQVKQIASYVENCFINSPHDCAASVCAPFKVTFNTLSFFKYQNLEHPPSSWTESFLLILAVQPTDHHTSISRRQKHMARHQNGCASRCYWLIETHLILNDQCPSEHFLVWCLNDRAADSTFPHAAFHGEPIHTPLPLPYH